MFWNSIVVGCLSAGLDLYLCRLTAGGCNVNFIIAVFAVVCMLTALSVTCLSLPVTDIFAAVGAADCWGVSSFISPLFRAVLWNSVLQLTFLQCWFSFQKGNFKLPKQLNFYVFLILLSMFIRSQATVPDYFYWNY